MLRKLQILERRHHERESEARRKARAQEESAQQRLDDLQRMMKKERDTHSLILEEKDREIANFRMELEAILQEMQALKEYQLKKRQMRTQL